jgi:glutathione peroxidase
MLKSISILTLLLAVTSFFSLNAQSTDMSKSIHQFEMKNIQGETVSLADYKDKTVLVVNVASKCGLTPQYADLEALYQEYKDRGLVILGFPANNFMGQEPGTDAEIQTFCSANYGVTFPMFSKISVKGKDIHPLYAFLTNKEKNGVVGGKVKWNFQKFLVDGNGQVVKSIAPTTSVKDAEVISEIEKLLN